MGQQKLPQFYGMVTPLPQLMSLRAERSLSSTVGRGQSRSSSSINLLQRSMLGERREARSRPQGGEISTQLMSLRGL